MTALDVANAHHLVTAGDLGDAVGSFVRALKRDNLSPNTIAAYESALRTLAEFLAARGYPTDVRRILPRHIDEWSVDLRERHKPASAHSRFRGAQRFFTWYAETDAAFASPMDRMRPPALPEYPRIAEPALLEDLVRACQGPRFEDRRDMALVHVFFATGARRAEIANLRYSPSDASERDLDLQQATIRLFDTGRRERIVSLDAGTVAALDDYLSARRAHPHANLPWLWLGKDGHLNDSGVGRALWDRGMRAGRSGLHRLGHGLWIVTPDMPQRPPPRPRDV